MGKQNYYLTRAPAGVSKILGSLLEDAKDVTIFLGKN